MRLVIIGSGPAGINAIEAIREVNKTDEVILISEENVLPYTQVCLADFISGRIGENALYFRDASFYKINNVKHILGIKAKKVDIDAQTVKLESGDEVKYDKLLIATGARAFIPRIEGVYKIGVYPLQRIDDAKRILNFLKEVRVKRSVVIGAGPIGVEIAAALKHMGIEVVIVELLDRILPGMLDSTTSELVKNHLETMGIKIVLRESVSEILGKAKVKGVIVGEHKLDCELVVLATGIRPNIELIKETDIDVNRGILVDQNMRTSINNVYAAGDVAETIGILKERTLVPTWPNAVTQGRVAGYNMAGRYVTHLGSIRTNVIKGIELPVVSIGYTSSELSGKKYEEVEYSARGLYRKAIFVGDSLIGFQSVGSYDDIRLAGVYQYLILRRIQIEKKREILLGRYPLIMLYPKI